MASYPTYDPNIWVGGISSKDYKSITSKKNNYPNQSARLPGRVRAGLDVQGVSTAGGGRGRLLAARLYPCPSAYPIGGTLKGNYEAEAFGTISVHAGDRRCPATRSSTSSPTRPGCARAGCTRRRTPRTRSPQMAKAFGLGKPTGLDLPSEADGPDRRPGLEAGLLEGHQGLLLREGQDRLPRGRAERPAARGLPAAAGQGELRRRLRLPRRRRGELRDRPGRHARHAAAAGPRLRRGRQRRHAGRRRTSAKAIISPERQLVRSIEPKPAGTVPVRRRRWRCCAARCAASTERGHRLGRCVRAGFPLDKVPVAGKTGTGRGLRQADDVVVRLLRAGRQAAVRRGDDGQPGRHRRRGTSGPSVGRDLRDAVRRQGQHGRPRKGSPRRRTGSPPTALPTSGRTAPSSPPEGAGRPPTGRRTAPTAARLRPTGATRWPAMSVGYRPAPTPCAPARRGARLLHRDSPLRRLDWRCCSRVARRCALIGARAGLVGDPAGRARRGRRPARLPEEAPAQPRDRPGARRCVASLFDYRLLRAYAPVLYVLSIVGLVAVLVAAGRRRSTARTRGSCCRPASRCSRRSSPRSRSSSAWRCCWRRSATPRTTPRDVDVAAGAGVRRRAARRWSCCSPTSARRWSSAALVLGVVAVSGAPAPLGRRAARRCALLGAFVAVQAGRAQALPARPVHRVRRPDAPTRRAPATTSGRRGSRSAPAGSSGKGLFHGAQTQGKFVPEQQTDFVFTVAGEELGFVGAGG